MQTGELMVPSTANTYTIEILQYVSMTSTVQYSQYLYTIGWIVLLYILEVGRVHFL